MGPKKPKAKKEERQAVRKTGAKKDAKKGIIADIYSAEKGGRLVTSGTSSRGASATNQGAVTTNYRTPSKAPKYASGSQEEKSVQKQVAADVNNAEFRGTRLGSRLENKAKRSAQKAGTSVKIKVATVKSKKRS
jgi:hypothetical protein